MKLPTILLPALLALGISAARADSARRPNILVFFVDDMGWAQPGCYGGKMAPTPNIDSLAQGGMRFTDGYSSGCICSPGRVGLLTGRYQARTGHDGASPKKTIFFRNARTSGSKCGSAHGTIATPSLGSDSMSSHFVSAMR